MGLPLQFGVHSISPEPFERFSLNFTQMFLSVRWCAGPMALLRRLKVKVAVQGHGIYPFNFVSAPYLLNPLNDFHKLHTNVSLGEEVCRTHDSAMQTQVKVTVQDHWITPFNFVSILKVFHLTLVRETIFRIYDSVTQTQGQCQLKVMDFTLQYLVPSIFL